MLPWLWLWNPNIHWPFSGDVVQDIAPDTRWFFGAIPPRAGVGALEKEIFETASYGRQLGLLMDVVLALSDQAEWQTDEQRRRHVELQAVHREIERVKGSHREALLASATAALERLQSSDPDAFRQVLARFGSRSSPG
ncbi:hypothetical protein [Caldimonas brevitalea]|uniref:Uncharacterized protein n=1 Tax=Caldimonas brevitalea TaxID=413882 RepID=A0A0G3BJX1_9BURK|nr:hypothetical protein [Caldimonas brevitalea]AKJ26805.1 hypothetical protein AAW51_0114 [Caldimonas brevitalea]